MTSKQGVPDRVLGVWGGKAYAWSGEERPRVAGFPVDVSGHQRVLGFPADPLGAASPGWFRRHAHPGLRHRRPEGRRARIVVAVVAILDSGEGKQRRGRFRHLGGTGPDRALGRR